jgi:hypothetical protein
MVDIGPNEQLTVVDKTERNTNVVSIGANGNFDVVGINSPGEQSGPDLEVGGPWATFGGPILKIYFAFSCGKMTICPNAHNYGPPKAKITTISSAAGEYLDDFWRRRSEIRRLLASWSKFLTIFSAAGKIFE